MPVWEYRVISLVDQPEDEEMLNVLGEERWELVAIVPQGPELRAYLKRESIYSSSARTTPGEAASATHHAASPMPSAQTTVRVSARDDPGVSGWVDTGIDVGEEHIGISFSIMGEVLDSSWDWVGPEGAPRHMALNPAIGKELPSGCLVAMIGEGGTVEPVYNSGFFATPEQGRLYLAVNGDSYEDNDGEFTVNLMLM